MRTHLRAVDVPWQSSAAESLIDFSGREGEVTVTISAFFGSHIVEKVRQKLSKTEGEDEAIHDLHWNEAGYGAVAVVFRSLVTFQIHPPQLPYGLLDESQYDVSAIPLYSLGLKSFDDWSECVDSHWAQHGSCPNPRFYEVINSDGVSNTSTCCSRWILLGHDAYCEIIAGSFEWSYADVATRAHFESFDMSPSTQW
jgi:hypothetical protein